MNKAEDTEEESALMVAISDEYGEILLQGVSDSYDYENLLYLDTGATSHMTGRKSFFHSIDESKCGIVRFGDGSTINYKR